MLDEHDGETLLPQLEDQRAESLDFARDDVLNLPKYGPFDVIFCRNVVIYFDSETQTTLWSRIVPLLTSSGALYIGHSERVSGPAKKLLVSDGITTYRPQGSRPN